MHKIALGIEYNGSRYHGWQRQNDASSIQENLEKALSRVANEKITVFCAGRTDVGVHGVGQVIHFKTTAIRKETAWTLGVNGNLPIDISVRWAKLVPDNFHARFSAIARQYRYIICNQKLRPAVLSQETTHFHKPLDVKRMNRAAQYLIGENDFASFGTVQCRPYTSQRNVMYINVSRFDKYVVIDIKANSFIHHMVRNIVGSLIKVGSGVKSEYWIAELLHARNSKLVTTTAKAEGLYLMSVDYPKHYNIPHNISKLRINPLILIN